MNMGVRSEDTRKEKDVDIGEGTCERSDKGRPEAADILGETEPSTKKSHNITDNFEMSMLFYSRCAALEL